MSANDSKPVSRVELENMQISLVSKVFGEADLLIARIERLRDDFPRLLHWEGKAAELEINRAKKLAEDLRSAANGFATKVLDEEKRQKAILSKYADGLIRDWRNEMHDAAAEAATRAAEKAVVKPITKATDAMARMLGELDEVKFQARQDRLWEIGRTVLFAFIVGVIILVFTPNKGHCEQIVPLAKAITRY